MKIRQKLKSLEVKLDNDEIKIMKWNQKIKQRETSLTKKKKDMQNDMNKKCIEDDVITNA